jgi:hypothetical protein
VHPFCNIQSGSSTNTPSLTIFYAELSDAGIYTCFASNSDGTGESDMTTLMVSGHFVPLMCAQNSLWVKIRYHVDLCVNEQPEQFFSYIMTKLSDAGIYTCFASNSDGTGESDMTTLMVSGTLFLVY